MINQNKKPAEHGRLRPSVVNMPLIGWREWVSLPYIKIPRIKAKIDTGARTSALHAFAIEPFTKEGIQKVRFSIHPLQHNNKQLITCEADVIDKRLVTDSGGHEEERYVIFTPIRIAHHQWFIEVTLTARENMLFRMLLGRNALRRRFVINPARSYLLSSRVSVP